MHPNRAAKILARVGSFLLLVSLGLRVFSLGMTLSGLHSTPSLQTGNESTPILGHYQLSTDQKNILFEQQVDRIGKTSWFSISVNGGPVSPIPEPSDSFGPFSTQGTLVLKQTGQNPGIIIQPPDSVLLAAAPAPDRSAIAFVTTRSSGPWSLYIAEANGQLSWLGEEDHYSDLHWSPDSQTLAFIAPKDEVDQIFLVDRQGQTLRQFTTDNSRKRLPAWSPDGKAIAFLAVKTSGPLTTGAITPTPNRLMPVPVLSPTPAFDPEEAFLLMPTPVNHFPEDIEVQWQPISGGQPETLFNPESDINQLFWLDNTQLAFSNRLPEQPQTSVLYGFSTLTQKTYPVYPPVEIAELACPERINRTNSGTITLTLNNLGPNPAASTVFVRTADAAISFSPVFQSNEGSTTAVSIPANERQSTQIAITAATGLYTQVSAVLSTGSSLVVSERQCTIQNTFFGLPNLPYIPALVPLTVIGFLFSLPWLIREKNHAYRWFWGSGVLLLIVFIVVETRLLLP